MKESRKTGHLLTEQINPELSHLDQCSTLELVEIILSEDRTITEAVEREMIKIAEAVELIVGKLRDGGRLIFTGAGTSGRLGVLEAAECPPTFGTDPRMIQAIIAGGNEAVLNSIEGAEDSRTESVEALSALGINEKDIIVGVAASSTTPFVESSLIFANDKGAGTVLVTCNTVKNSPADITISLLVGPEVIVGSTRMKAGTVTKMVLNMLTTASMVKLGKTLGNLMVDVQPKSAKLRDRAKRIVTHITGVSEDEALELLSKSEWDVKSAVVMQRRGVSLKEAKEILQDHSGKLRNAIDKGKK